MKKAYVKPVFLAEEFVAESSYASGVCGVPTHTELLLDENDCFCSTPQHKKCNHMINFDKAKVGTMYTGFDVDSQSNTGYSKNSNSNFTFWDYATTGDGEEANAYLFNSGIDLCDFLWSGNNADNVYVWNSVDKSNANTEKGFITGLIDTAKSLVEFFSNNSGDGGGHGVGYMGASFHSI